MIRNLLLVLVFFASSGIVYTCNAQISFSIKIIPNEPYYERPPAPSVNHVWVEGDWIWKGNHYERQSGHWIIPEKDHIWIKGEWIQNPDGSAYWQPGYWKPVPHEGIGNWIPEPRYLRPPKPSPRFLWVDGEWIWQNNNYIYQTGYWTIPDPNKIFIPGHWAQWDNGEWYWVKGYWKNIPQNVYVSEVPPDPFFERPPQPSPEHIWIEGEWSWRNNQFIRQPGYWIIRDPHKMWVRGYWHQRSDNGWYWIGGHWNWI